MGTSPGLRRGCGGPGTEAPGGRKGRLPGRDRTGPRRRPVPPGSRYPMLPSGRSWPPRCRRRCSIASDSPGAPTWRRPSPGSRSDPNRETPGQASSIRELWQAMPLPARLVEEVASAYLSLSDPTGAEPLVAIRSSTHEEDSEVATWAGEFDTFLFVRGLEAGARTPEAGLGRVLDGAGHRPPPSSGCLTARSRRRDRRAAHGGRPGVRGAPHRVRRRRPAPGDGDQRRPGARRGGRVRHGGRRSRAGGQERRPVRAGTSSFATGSATSGSRWSSTGNAAPARSARRRATTSGSGRPWNTWSCATWCGRPRAWRRRSCNLSTWSSPSRVRASSSCRRARFRSSTLPGGRPWRTTRYESAPALVEEAS